MVAANMSSQKLRSLAQGCASSNHLRLPARRERVSISHWSYWQMVAAVGESHFAFSGSLEGFICTDWWSHSHVRMGDANWGQARSFKIKKRTCYREERDAGERAWVREADPGVGLIKIHHTPI